MKDKYRIVIYLYYYEGYSMEEIGKMLHLNSAIYLLLKQGIIISLTT
ncbi:MAG TPA: sigma factor-like helix-turn-helix DNA-binding protein [Mobilitalea sp.]|nr:sigma factor-like helix-turn-helix DNA-binding protein [Mobilitalea sp.]